MSFKGILAVFLLVHATAAMADDAVGQLEKNLLEVRKGAKEARAVAKKTDLEMFRFKDQAVYSNATLKAMYLKMKALEKELLEQRALVDNEIMKLPGYRDLLKKRNSAYKSLRDLTDEEAFILRQLKTARIKTGEEK